MSKLTSVGTSRLCCNTTSKLVIPFYDSEVLQTYASKILVSFPNKFQLENLGPCSRFMTRLQVMNLFMVEQTNNKVQTEGGRGAGGSQN